MVIGATPVRFGPVLHLRGFSPDGEPYDADFAVNRTAQGELV